MYNIYKYQDDVRLQESMRAQDQSYTKWLVRHQEMKNRASSKMKSRLQNFLDQQTENPSIYEDDHYQTWRYIKQFRDIQDKKKFVGFKAFQHKPNFEMDKHFTERQRKQTRYLAQKSRQLVDSKVIPNEQISRSLRSQGPLNPKHTFRDTKKDNEYYQPKRMRYTNITDKQRMEQNSLTFDDKLQSVYKSFNMTKSKLGNTKISPLKDVQKSKQFDMIESTYSDIDKGQKYHYEVPNQEQKSVHFNRHERAPSENVGSRMNKTYFKTAKTLSLFGNRKAQELMFVSQYDRKKDLTNLDKNMQNESYVKSPIL